MTITGPNVARLTFCGVSVYGSSIPVRRFSFSARRIAASAPLRSSFLPGAPFVTNG